MTHLFKPSHYIKVPSHMQAVVSCLRLRSQVYEVLYMLQAPSCFFVSLLLFPSLYQTAAYAMGKHVPSGNLFPTVRSRRPTICDIYRPTDRLTDRTNSSTDRETRISVNQTRMPTDRPPYDIRTERVCCRPINRTTTDRTSPSDACTVLLPE